MYTGLTLKHITISQIEDRGEEEGKGRLGGLEGKVMLAEGKGEGRGG